MANWPPMSTIGLDGPAPNPLLLRHFHIQPFGSCVRAAVGSHSAAGPRGQAKMAAAWYAAIAADSVEARGPIRHRRSAPTPKLEAMQDGPS